MKHKAGYALALHVTLSWEKSNVTISGKFSQILSLTVEEPLPLRLLVRPAVCVSSPTLPYSVNIGREYFFLGCVVGGDAFESIGLVLAMSLLGSGGSLGSGLHL